LRRYELTVIISPDVPDDDVPDAVERLVRRPVESQGGAVQETDVWGRRRLAYPIQRHLEGNYVLTQLQLDPLRTGELERGLQISEEVIRHLLIRLDE
jgi:small subunit ribosomal protein S6